MFNNYLKIAVRNILRHKAYSFINIVGLALGITCCLLVYLYIRHETSFDSFHEKADRIHLAVCHLYRPELDIDLLSGVFVPAGPIFHDEIPEVEDYVRIWNYVDVVSYGSSSIKERITFADPSIFNIFTIPLTDGDPGAFASPDAVVLTRSTAAKYFSDQNAIGKTLSIRLGTDFHSFIVRGVAENIPPNSSVTFGILLPFDRIRAIRGEEFFTDWRYESATTYLLLREGADVGNVSAKISKSMERFVRADYFQHGVRSLREAHFDPATKILVNDHGNTANVYVLSIIGIMVLLVACFNFMNLSIARLAGRAEEIGVRRSIGADRRTLIIQFLVEAVTLSSIALILSMVLTELFLPIFNSLAGKRLDFNPFSDPLLPAALIGITIFTGILAGAYPAILSSGFQPVSIMRKQLNLRRTHPVSRVLVTAQFVLCVFLVLSTMVMSRQINFMKSKDLGFDDSTLIAVEANDPNGEQLYDRYRRAIIAHPSVLATSATDASFTGRYRTSGNLPKVDQNVFVHLFRVDYDFMDAVGVQLAAGRNFSPDQAADAVDKIIVNETLARYMGWGDRVGEQITIGGLTQPMTVIGIVKDFHTESMRNEIVPVALHMNRSNPIRYFYIRVDRDNMAATLAALRERWSEVAPNLPFEYGFIGNQFDRLYYREECWADIVRYSAAFAIFIACLGLLGLTMLLVRQRTKEIGIRKVLGATVLNILGLINRQFMLMVGIACVIAWPVGYWVMNRWLEGFAYRVGLSAGPFIASAGAALVIAFVTISIQAIRAALADPVKALRHE